MKIEEGKFVKGGQNAPPTTTRPPPPVVISPKLISIHDHECPQRIRADALRFALERCAGALRAQPRAQFQSVLSIVEQVLEQDHRWANPSHAFPTVEFGPDSPPVETE